MTRTDTKSLAATQVPVIDIAPLYAGDDPTAVARELYRAATEVGFIYVSGHGISRELIAQTREHGFRFFQLPAKLQEAGLLVHAFSGSRRDLANMLRCTFVCPFEQGNEHCAECFVIVRAPQ